MKISWDELHDLSRVFNLAVYAVPVGIAGGLFAIFFRLLIALSHNLFFFGIWSFDYDVNAFTPESPWGAGIIFIPVIGALLVALIVSRYAPEIRGSGVPHVLRSIYFEEGKIHWRVAGLKSIAAAVSIGSGASIGREGPIVQISAALGALLGFRQIPADRAILISAGAAGGVAAIFNAPLGGFFFALEFLLPTIQVFSLLPVMIAVLVANTVTVGIIGSRHLVELPTVVHWLPPAAAGGLWAAFLGLGILAGFHGIGFQLGVRLVKNKLAVYSHRFWVRFATGMLGVGIILYGFEILAGGYYVDGVSFAALSALLAGVEYPLGFIALLLAGKFLASVLSLASGASGGIFSPLIFAGGMLGALYAGILTHLLPGTEIPVAMLILAGMAAGISGASGRVLAGTFTVIEMTGAGIPAALIFLSAITAGAVHRVFLKQNIYDEVLWQRGMAPHEGLMAARSDSTPVRDIADTRFRLVTGALPPVAEVPFADDSEKLLRRVPEGHWYLLARRGASPDRVQAHKLLLLNDDATVAFCQATMRARKLRGAVVVSRHGHVIGVVTEHELCRYEAEVATLLWN